MTARARLLLCWLVFLGAGHVYQMMVPRVAYAQHTHRERETERERQRERDRERETERERE
jgi:hypothetical protein